MTVTTPRWSDAAIYLYAKDAIRDYSSYFPMRVTRVELVEDSRLLCGPVRLHHRPSMLNARKIASLRSE